MLKMWVCWMIKFHGDFRLCGKYIVPSTLDLKGMKAGHFFFITMYRHQD